MLTNQIPALLGAALVGTAAAMFDCKNMRSDNRYYDLSALGGHHAVVTIQDSVAGSVHNTSYTFDICEQLGKTKGIPAKDQCPNGTRVCAIKRLRSADGKTDVIDDIIAIAGELQGHGGSRLDHKLQRLIAGDNSKEDGLRVTFQGGANPLKGSHKRKQRAEIDFICDPEFDGTENEWDPEDHFDLPGDKEERRVRREDDDDNDDNDDEGDDEGGDDDEDDGGKGFPDETQLLKKDAALVWESYGPSESGIEDKVDVLKLTWRTKHVCLDKKDRGDDTSGWGFFTWFFLIVCLAIAAYLIFGAWLNYTRYGARGWDLLPHGDTIRDVPYLFRDYMRKVLNTVQGAGSRGGYSAV